MITVHTSSAMQIAVVALFLLVSRSVVAQIDDADPERSPDASQPTSDSQLADLAAAAGRDHPLQEPGSPHRDEAIADANAPFPILVDLLNSVGVDGIGPDQPGGYGSGLTGPGSAPEPAGGSGSRAGTGDAVDQTLNEHKQQIQQHQAGQAAAAAADDSDATAAAAPQQRAAQPQQQQQPPPPGQSLDGMLNSPVNAGLPGGSAQQQPGGQLPTASNAFGIPPIPPMADFTLPPTPPAPSETASSKDQAKDVAQHAGPGVPGAPVDAASDARAWAIGVSVAAAVVFGCFAGAGLMWFRHKHRVLTRSLSSPV